MDFDDTDSDDGYEGFGTGHRRPLFPTVIAIGVGVLIWLAVSISGLAPWLGYTDSSYSSDSATFVQVSDFGDAFGLSSFFFLSGQEVYVDYDLTVRRGAVMITVREHGGSQAEQQHLVTTSGSGTFSVQVSRTDLYHIDIVPTTSGGVGPGYDVDISASWGGRWP